jgi:hypothetical protein
MSLPIRPVSDEFREAQLGDARLTLRLVDLADELASHPNLSLPQAFGVDEAGLNGAYLFFGNEKVTPEGILKSHWGHTLARAAAHPVIYAAHDTTEIHHPCSELTLYLHLCLGVGTPTAEDELVGLLGAEFNQRRAKKPKRDSQARKQDPERESLRWGRLVLEVEARVQGTTSVIHVMDREADIYELLAMLVERKIRFIIRVKANRACQGETGDRELLFPILNQATGQVTRTVPLSRREKPWSPKDAQTHPEREMREATLSYAAQQLTIFKPLSAQDPNLPPSLTLNYVHVWEPNPPLGVTAVDWKLVTSEPIGTPGEIVAGVDGYRKRWRIEELNKGLKTGCGVEKTQLEGKPNVLNHVAVSLVIAWRMLRLRNLERTCPNAPASDALGPLELEVLRTMTRRPMSPVPTAREALWAMASLGGHLKRNGPPGWLTLMRGYSRLLDYVAGWRAAREDERNL